MNKLQFLFLGTLLLLLAGACKKKAIPEASPTGTSTPGLRVNVINTEFRTFSAKGKMQLEKPGEKIASNVSVRIKKDSVIWVSVVPGLGIEVARMMITPDTIQLLDRMHREYFAGNFDMLHKRYNVSASFEMLQAMLLGNYLPGLNGSEKEMVHDKLQQTRQQRNNLTIDQYLDTERRKLTQMNITDTQSKDAINATYKEFTMVETSPIASEILLLLQRASAPDPNSRDMVISVKYSKMALNETGLEFPFSVPSDYVRK